MYRVKNVSGKKPVEMIALTLATLLAMTPTKSPAIPFVQESVTTQTYGWAHVRMNNPTLLASMSEEVSDPRGRKMLRALAPGGDSLKLGLVPSGAVRSGSKTGADNSNRGIPNARWENLVSGEQTEANLSLGTTYLGAENGQAVYHGVATKNGKIYAGPAKGGPFFPSRIKTYTGLWKNGYPEVEDDQKGTGGVVSANAKAGQEYEVTYSMTAKVEGSFNAEGNIADGKVTKLNLSGKVKPVDNIPFSAVWVDGDFNFCPGMSYTKKLRIVVGGTEKVTIKFDEPAKYKSTSSMIRINAKDVTITGGVATDVPITFTIRPAAEDVWNEPIPITVSAFGGNKSTEVVANLHIETLWLIQTAKKKFAGGSTFDYEGTLSINSDGYYLFQVLMDGDHPRFGVLHYLDRKDGSGKKPAFAVNSDGNNLRSSSRSGYYPGFKTMFELPTAPQTKFVAKAVPGEEPISWPGDINVLATFKDFKNGSFWEPLLP